MRERDKRPVPEFIDPVFAKTSPKRSFSVIEYERFRLVSANTGSINSGTVLYVSFGATSVCICTIALSCEFNRKSTKYSQILKTLSCYILKISLQKTNSEIEIFCSFYVHDGYSLYIDLKFSKLSNVQ